MIDPKYFRFMSRNSSNKYQVQGDTQRIAVWGNWRADIGVGEAVGDAKGGDLFDNDNNDIRELPAGPTQKKLGCLPRGEGTNLRDMVHGR